LETTYLFGYEVKTLSSYSTPYFYAEGKSPLGSVNHFRTIRALKNYMARKIAAGKLTAKVNASECILTVGHGGCNCLVKP